MSVTRLSVKNGNLSVTRLSVKNGKMSVRKRFSPDKLYFELVREKAGSYGQNLSDW